MTDIFLYLIGSILHKPTIIIEFVCIPRYNWFVLLYLLESGVQE